MPGMLRRRKIIYPVLRDPTGSYVKALGLRAWPLATLLDRKGRTVWQAETGGARFSDACEAALEELMRANPKKEAGSDSGAR